MGIGNADEVWLPLSRRVAVVFMTDLPDRQLAANTWTARRCNTLIAGAARRWIYHHPDDDPTADLIVQPSYRDVPLARLDYRDPAPWGNGDPEAPPSVAE